MTFISEFNLKEKHNVLILIGTLLLCYFQGNAQQTDTLATFLPDSLVSNKIDSVSLSPAKKTNPWLPDYKQHIGLTYTAGFDIVSNYLWRGFAVGGLSFQPNLNVGYGGAYIGTWWNIGAESNMFKAFFPEVDFYIGFSRWGLTIELTHMHYFGGNKFFDFSQKDIYGGGNTNNTELHLKYRISDRLPISIDWYTHIGSEDGFVVDMSDNFVAKQLHTGESAEGLRVKRAFSSYFQLGYDINLPLGILLPVKIGMTPWRSRYTQYEKSFAVCMISIGLEKSFDLGICKINVFGKAMLNPDRIKSDNVIVKISERDLRYNDKNSHLVGTIGMGVWF